MGSIQTELPLFGGGPGRAQQDTPEQGRVYTIPPSAPFLASLARAILAGDLPQERAGPPSQLDLAGYEIYLPNRAACRALADAFLKLSPSGATLLPRIRALGSAEEDTLLLLRDELDLQSLDQPDLPVAPAIGPLDRRLALTKLIMAWSKSLREGRPDRHGRDLRIAETPAAAAELALELMRLMDEAETEGASLTRLAELIPERFAGHEQLSLGFLGIVIEAWPAYLTAIGCLNPVDRRNRIMALEAQRLRRTNPSTPVIIAGSTGSIPATAELMKAVCGLARGAIVLPGLDLDLDVDAWGKLADHPEHSQSGLYLLLGELGTARDGVTTLKGCEARGTDKTRARLMSETLRPSATLGAWPAFIAAADRQAARDCLAPVSLLAAPTEHDEAAAIALIMREAMETPGKTASLITPDRTLARRVAAELSRWQLTLDASSGEPVLATPAGILFDLVAEAAATGAQIALLALMKHPLTRLGLPEGEGPEHSPAVVARPESRSNPPAPQTGGLLRSARNDDDGADRGVSQQPRERAAQRIARIVEIAAMRQPWCGEGVAALAESLDEARKPKPRHAAIDRLAEADWEAAHDLVGRMRAALAPLAALAEAGPVSLDTLAAAHLDCARQLMAGGDDERPAATSDRAAIERYLAALSTDMNGPDVRLADYPALFRSLIKLETIRPKRPAHPRLQILSAMEARLTTADLVILGGLNEGTWPEAADPGPWLNRAMREALGLPPPERKTRLAGHDFWQLLGAREVVLTRALKCEGTPTVPSRWLMRLQTMLKGLGLSDAIEPPRPWLHWASLRNEAPAPPPVKPPAPCPPLAARPRSLSVSDIETLIANPYAIYARHILALSPLNPLAAEPGGAEKGQIIHEVLHRFARRFAESLPRNPARMLMTIFDECAALYGERAHVQAFWRPRMERFAGWFADTEAARRSGALVLSELRGRFEFEAPGGPFRLRARADRIDLHTDGGLAIYDYKSGGMPSDAAVTAFKAPQLALEALIAVEGGFDGIDSRRVARLAYISAKGGEPAGLERELRAASDVLAEGARAGLTALVARFDDDATPYTALRRAAFGDSYRYDDYAHLARTGEWAGAEEEV
jgi:ATP-dependent helicase/nuclease subunit B